jgi:hypothetical protein
VWAIIRRQLALLRGRADLLDWPALTITASLATPVPSFVTCRRISFLLREWSSLI